MALVKGTNSYVNVTEANRYFETRLDVAAWDEADCPQQEAALVTATMLLDEQSWTGFALSDAQELAWPRAGQYYARNRGRYLALDSYESSDDIVPPPVKRATYELAYHLLNNDGILDAAGGADDITIGPIKLTNTTANSQIPLQVRRIYRDLVVTGDNLWFRAN